MVFVFIILSRTAFWGNGERQHSWQQRGHYTDWPAWGRAHSQSTEGEQKSGWWLDLIILKVSANLGDSMEYELILTCAEQIFKSNRWSQWLGGSFQTKQLTNSEEYWNGLSVSCCFFSLHWISMHSYNFTTSLDFSDVTSSFSTDLGSLKKLLCYQHLDTPGWCDH